MCVSETTSFTYCLPVSHFEPVSQSAPEPWALSKTCHNLFSVSQRMSPTKRSAVCQILTPTSYYCMLLSYLLIATLARQGLNSRGALSAKWIV